MVLFTADAWVWLEHGEDAFIPVRMIKQAGDKIIAKASTNEQYELDVSRSYAEVHPSSLTAVDNMVAMEELSEAAILHNLRLRFDDNLIYTHISNILVSINPFKQLPIYSPAIMKEYRERLAKLEKVAPHVYSLADAAYANLRSESTDQSVIISGESGAGKTEAMKLVLQYMAEMSGQGNDVEQQLLSSNPIIEAFGNAKTVRNNNSSRFGKLVEIKFNERFHIVGANIKNYLLEKSRIVVPGAGERNYHLFYQICAGATGADRDRWALDHAAKFRILAVGGCLEVDGVDDVDEYKALRNALDILAFTPAEVDEIMRATSACLHLGNVDWQQNAKDEASCKNPEVLVVVARMLKIDVQALNTSLISQRKMMGRESILTVRSQASAENATSALTKKIYSNMFNWLINRINATLGVNAKGASRVVGVLDIFGFEIFGVNRFEQLCINFANEKMQQHFNAHIFQMEQNEYLAEKIDVAHVSYVDNQPCLDLIENGKTSILGMSDEELKLPGGGDDNLLTRMHQAHANNKYYTKPKTLSPVFTIAHYAGPVEYTIEGFTSKNSDSLEANISEVLQASQSPFVAALIPAESGAVRTLGSQFRAQLVALMDTLNKTSPHFIRCIKSNNLKVSDTFDSQMVLRQLRYLGLKEVVNIRQLGYPIRRLHLDFVRRYGLLHRLANQAVGALAKISVEDLAAQSRAILATSLPNASEKDWRVGLTKVFLRQNLSTMLESAREKKLTKIAVYLQSKARTRIWRQRFLKVKGAMDHLRKVMDAPDSTPELIDSAISAYEKLKFKTNTKLIQQAIKIRNRLFEQIQARNAVASALKSQDIETMRVAIQVAEKALLDEESHPPFGQLKNMFKALVEYRGIMEAAVKSRDIPQLQAALARAKAMNINGPEEKKAADLLASLEEEIRVAARLAEEKRAREIESLKKNLQVAMTAKSGAMLDAAIKKALADPSFNLASDPLVIDAQKLVTTLEKEVKVFQLAQELKAALDTDDLGILESTVALAMEKGFQNHNLTIQCKEKIVNLKAREELLNMLAKAVATKNEVAIVLALENVSSMENVERFPTIMQAAEYKNAEAALIEAQSRKAQAKQESEANKTEAESRMIESLRTAIESKNQQLLEQALAGAKEKGVNKESGGVLGDQFNTASKLLSSIAAENDMRRQELLSANVQVAAEQKRNVRRSMIVMGQTSLLDTQLVAERKTDFSFDPAVYTQAQYELAQYPDLRAIQEFAGDKKAFRTGMLKHSKEIIPRSLCKFENQSTALSSLASPTAASSGNRRASIMAGGIAPSDYSEKMLSEKAVSCFKMIQGFMLDRSYSFPDTLVTELFQEILLFPALRNETYLQLLKQLSNNESMESYTRGWMLLCLMVDTVPPLSDFINYLLHFVHAYTGTPSDAVLAASPTPEHLVLAGNYANYALHHLKPTVERFKFHAPGKDSAEHAKALAQKEAGQPIEVLKGFALQISVDHVAAFRERAMVPAKCRISLPDGTQMDYTASPWQNNTEIVAALCEASKLKDADYYALFEMRGTDCQYLYGSDNLLDVQLMWAKQERKEAVKKGFFAKIFSKAEVKPEDTDDWAENPGVRRFLLKRRIFPKNMLTQGEPLGDKQAQASCFATVQTEVALGQHVVEEEAAVKMATIARTLQESNTLVPLGPIPRPAQASAEASDLWVQLKLSDVPMGASLAKKNDAKKWAGKIDKLAASLGASQNLDLWLAEARAMPTFGCAFYPVVRNEDPNVPLKLPTELVVAINYLGLRILDRKGRSQLDHFPLLNVLGWSSSPIRFVVKVKLNKPIGAGINMVTFRFNTYNPKMGKEMCDLLFSLAQEMLRSVGLNK